MYILSSTCIYIYKYNDYDDDISSTWLQQITAIIRTQQPEKLGHVGWFPLPTIAKHHLQ